MAVWAATATRGLLHAKADERFGWIVSAIGFEQGMPSDKAFSILPRSDSLWIATNRGIITYRPSAIAPKLAISRVLSQRIHEISELSGTIALDYPQNGLLIEVAGLSSRTFAEEFQYAFILKNSSGDIVDKRLSKDAQFTPSGLKDGEYTVEATAFDRDLNASEPLTIRFSIAKAPFPWTSTALAFAMHASRSEASHPSWSVVCKQKRRSAVKRSTVSCRLLPPQLWPKTSVRLTTCARRLATECVWRRIS